MCGEDSSNAMPVKREIIVCLKAEWAELPLSIHVDKIQGSSLQGVYLFGTALLSLCREALWPVQNWSPHTKGETGSV